MATVKRKRHVSRRYRGIRLAWVRRWDMIQLGLTQSDAATGIGLPMREKYLDFALPDLDGSELEEIRKVLESNWLTSGPVTREFEKRFAAAVGAPWAVAVNSCTAALHLALEAFGLEKGDVVLTSPYTFAASAEVVRYFDAEPRFVDVEVDTLNLCPRALADEASKLAAEGRVLKAILPVHLAGHSCDMAPIEATARRYGLALLEDAAHAFPAKYRGTTIGAPRPGMKSASAFSFYATKTLTTGEGGMLTTADPEIAERCRIMSLHGISRDAWKRYTSEGSWRYEIVAPGFKYNLTDLASALGLAQLRKVETMRARRQKIAERYQDAFREHEELSIPVVREGIEHAWHLYILRLNLDRLSCGRDDFVQRLRQRKIGVSVHFIPLHIHPYYRQLSGYRPQDFPVAYEQYLRAVSLPIYSRMTDQDVEDVIDAVTSLVAENRKSHSCAPGF